ncbi:MAG: hypothetical protein WCD79_22265 [Chthoniobacteraceae bacterium]
MGSFPDQIGCLHLLPLTLTAIILSKDLLERAAERAAKPQNDYRVTYYTYADALQVGAL